MTGTIGPAALLPVAQYRHFTCANFAAGIGHATLPLSELRFKVGAEGAGERL